MSAAGPPDRDRVEHLVREVLGAERRSAIASSPLLDFVSEQDVLSARSVGRSLRLTPRAIVTPLARESADRYGVVLEVVAPSSAPTPSSAVLPVPGLTSPQRSRESEIVALGADHGGFELKERLKRFLEAEAGYTVIDLGAFSADPVDYPDIAHAVAGLVERGEAWRGIVIDGVGIGSCMAANRHSRVRAAMATGIPEATAAREHNDANVLCLGGRTLGELLARAITCVFLTTEFAGGRHARRVAKI